MGEGAKDNAALMLVTTDKIFNIRTFATLQTYVTS